jgi:hypothetical protein
MAELVFEVTQEADGGYCAECLTENIVTQGDSWDELRSSVIEAVSAYFFDTERLPEFAFTWSATRCRTLPDVVSGGCAGWMGEDRSRWSRLFVRN